MLNIPQMSWEDIKTDIYPEIFTKRVDAEDKWPAETTYFEDTVYYPIESLSIAFIIELSFTDGTYERQAVSESDLVRWGINRHILHDTVVKEFVRFPTIEWERVHCSGCVYAPPDFSRFWTNILLCPGYLETLGLKGRPLLMVSWVDDFIVTGDRDFCGRRSIKRISKSSAPDGRPLTPRPLVLEGKSWHEL